MASDPAATGLILSGARVYAPDRPGASAVAVRDGRICFVGDDLGARAAAPGAPEVALSGRLVTPAFVDAHLHAIQTGQLMAGLDLHAVSSREEVLGRVRAYARSPPTGVAGVRSGLGRARLARSHAADPERTGPGGARPPGLPGPGRRAFRGRVLGAAGPAREPHRPGRVPLRRPPHPGRPSPLPHWNGPALHRRGPSSLRAVPRCAPLRPRAWPRCTSSAARIWGRWRTSAG